VKYFEKDTPSLSVPTLKVTASFVPVTTLEDMKAVRIWFNVS
jgi:hypothetical protein